MSKNYEYMIGDQVLKVLRPLNFGTWLVSGCGISTICNTPEGVRYWIGEMVKRGGVPIVMRWAALGLLIACLAGNSQARELQYHPDPAPAPAAQSQGNTAAVIGVSVGVSLLLTWVISKVIDYRQARTDRDELIEGKI